MRHRSKKPKHELNDREILLLLLSHTGTLSIGPSIVIIT